MHVMPRMHQLDRRTPQLYPTQVLQCLLDSEGIPNQKYAKFHVCVELHIEQKETSRPAD